MKHLFVLFLICSSFHLLAQEEYSLSSMEKKNNQKAVIYYNKIIDKSPVFATLKAPDKWVAEPVVILAQKIYISLYNSNVLSQNLKYKGVVRKRILIQEQSALEDFSEFYFQASELFGIDLIKSDGTKIEINIEDAIKVEKDIPTFYKDNYHSSKYYKIAIPNLEVGDILDYYKVYSVETTEELELITNLSDEYPILHSEYSFDVNKAWVLLYKVLNSDLEFIKTKGGYNGNGEWKEHIINYKLTSTFPPYDPERWDYSLLTEPSLKIRAFIGRSAAWENHQDGTGVIIPAFGETQKELKFIENDFAIKIKSLKLKDKNETDKIDLIYRTIRLWFLRGVHNGEGSQFNMNQYAKIRSNVFAFLFSKYLTKNDIPNNVMITIPRQLGIIDNVLTKDEIEFTVFIPSTKKSYFPPDNFNIPGEVNYNFYSATGYLTSLKEILRKNISLKEVKLGKSSFKSHISNSNIKIKIQDNNSMHFENQITYKGAYKELYSPILVLGTDYFRKECYAMSNNHKSLDKADEYERKKTSKKLDFDKIEIKELKEKREDWIKQDFETEEIENYELLNYGNTKNDPTLSYKYSFKSNDYLAKAGANLIFNIGLLIQGQVELSEKEKNKRTKPIQFNFAKTIINDIEVELPEGLIAKGLDALNVNVDNPYGAFKSTAVQEGNFLKVKTSKIYKEQTVAPQNWPDLVEMLEAAYNFSQKKIILKKQ